MTRVGKTSELCLIAEEDKGSDICASTGHTFTCPEPLFTTPESAA